MYFWRWGFSLLPVRMSSFFYRTFSCDFSGMTSLRRVPAKMARKCFHLSANPSMQAAYHVFSVCRVLFWCCCFFCACWCQVIWRSDVGGSEGWQGPGNRFVSSVRARGVRCLVRMSLERHAGPFPFSLSAWVVLVFLFWPEEVFPFPFLKLPVPFLLRSQEKSK